MELSRGQNGIQQLLAAEQEAQQFVNAARNGRHWYFAAMMVALTIWLCIILVTDSYLCFVSAKMARLRQAKEEAEKEVAEFRAKIEADFQRKLAESSGDSGANVKWLEQETEEKIHHLKNEAARISSDVVQMLLKHVITVKN